MRFFFLFSLIGGNNSASLLCHCIIFSHSKSKKAKKRETEKKGKKENILCSFLCQMRVCRYGLSFFITHKCLFSFFFLRLYVDTCLNSGDRSLWKNILFSTEKERKKMLNLNEKNATFNNLQSSEWAIWWCVWRMLLCRILLFHKSAIWK